MFGEMVRAHRRRLGMTQEELAAATRGIRGLESGAIGVPRPRTARLIADAFGLGEAEREAFLMASAGAAAGPVSTVVPAQLPAPVRGFAGRLEELALLDEAMSDEGDSTGSPAPVVISAVSGTAGVGKAQSRIVVHNSAESSFHSLAAPSGQTTCTDTPRPRAIELAACIEYRLCKYRVSAFSDTADADQCFACEWREQLGDRIVNQGKLADVRFM